MIEKMWENEKKVKDYLHFALKAKNKANTRFVFAFYKFNF